MEFWRESHEIVVQMALLGSAVLGLSMVEDLHSRCFLFGTCMKVINTNHYA